MSDWDGDPRVFPDGHIDSERLSTHDIGKIVYLQPSLEHDTEASFSVAEILDATNLGQFYSGYYVTAEAAMRAAIQSDRQYAVNLIANCDRLERELKESERE